MRLRDGKAAPPLAGTDAAGVIGGPDRDGSKDELFFEAKPWLDSDSDDDFHSVRGDFTPSRGSTPDNRYSYRQTPLSWRVPVDSRPKPTLPVEKKRRLFELLQEKQHYDDEDDDTATDVSGDMENNSTVHAEEHLEASRKDGKVNKSSKPGCFPTLISKHNFRMSRNTKKEQKPK